MVASEVYRRYKFTSAKVEVEEHRVAVYAGKKTDWIIKAKYPGYLLRNSLVSPSAEAANAIVLYDYQRTRKADHPREFLKGFRGVCVTDGYQVYHTLEL